MGPEERARIAARLLRARREAGLTQRELAERLGVTTRSVQNYESGAVVPYRHLRAIESLARKRRGWILEDERADSETLAELISSLEKQQALMLERFDELRSQLERLRDLRETRTRQRSSP